MTPVSAAFGVLVLCGVALFVLSGCFLADPPRSFTCVPSPEWWLHGAAGVGGPARPHASGFGPVTVPPYLDRPQIVTRTSRAKLVLADFDQWAGPLADTIARVLSEDLSLLVPMERVVLHPGRGRSTRTTRSSVEAWQFDRGPGNQVVLSGTPEPHGSRRQGDSSYERPAIRRRGGSRPPIAVTLDVPAQDHRAPGPRARWSVPPRRGPHPGASTMSLGQRHSSPRPVTVHSSTGRRKSAGSRRRPAIRIEHRHDRVTPSVLGTFELDANVTTGVLGTSGSTTTSHDWDQVFADNNVTPPTRPAAPSPPAS